MINMTNRQVELVLAYIELGRISPATLRYATMPMFAKYAMLIGLVLKDQQLPATKAHADDLAAALTYFELKYDSALRDGR